VLFEERMFIKKDVRKVPQILADATSRAVSAPPSPDPASSEDTNEKDGGGGIVREIRFARRAPEFLPSCNVSLLLEPRYRPALDNLVQLSLYDCGLQSLTGIEKSNDTQPPLFPKLESLDLGRNPRLTNESMPDTFHTQFPRLVQIWLDDCSFGPNIPSSLLELRKIEVVRMTGNQLEGELEDGIGIRYWENAKVLALDGNKITSIGRGIGRMKYLEKLHLRGNNLASLPEGVPSASNCSLIMIGLSSNQLSSLPSSLLEAGSSLKELYLNGNQIEELPDGLAEKLVGLKKLNLAHNSIGKGAKITAGSQDSSNSNSGDEDMEHADFQQLLPQDFVERFGTPEPLTGNCVKEGECMVRLEGNPLSDSIRKKFLEEEKRKTKETMMETEVIE